MIPLWIDTDACHDDSLALLMACALRYFSMAGISTTYGAVSLDYATRNAASLLTALQVNSVLVFPGEEKPSVGMLPPEAPGSGLDGSGLLSFPQGPKQPDHSALSALASTLQRCPPQQLCIVCLGPLTNIAAFAMQYPDLVPLIDIISVSAGVDHFNLKADPHATEVVMNLVDVISPHVPPGSQLPQVLVCEPQENVSVTQEWLEKIKRGRNRDKYTVFRQMLFELLAHYADHITPQICDPVAVTALLPQRLNRDLGLQYSENGLVQVTDPTHMWNLVLESIEELEMEP